MRHFIDLADAGKDGLRAILDEAHRRKAERRGLPKARVDADAPLNGYALAMVFEKPSTRTRFSFDLAMRQLGGSTIVTASSDTQLGRGETVADTARVLSRMVDCIMLRTADHSVIETLADAATVPVINGLTDLSHPCQAMADIMTIEERTGRNVAGTCWAYLGDGNNMAHSLIEAASVCNSISNSAFRTAMTPTRPSSRPRARAVAASTSSARRWRQSMAQMSSSPTPGCR